MCECEWGGAISDEDDGRIGWVLECDLRVSDTRTFCSEGRSPETTLDWSREVDTRESDECRLSDRCRSSSGFPCGISVQLRYLHLVYVTEILPRKNEQRGSTFLSLTSHDQTLHSSYRSRVREQVDLELLPIDPNLGLVLDSAKEEEEEGDLDLDLESRIPSFDPCRNPDPGLEERKVENNLHLAN